jgi:hypothetical protein
MRQMMEKALELTLERLRAVSFDATTSPEPQQPEAKPGCPRDAAASAAGQGHARQR